MSAQIRKALSEHTSSLPYLIMKGTDRLGELVDRQSRISFGDWARGMRPGLSDGQCDDERLEWLWEMLCSNPDVRRVLGPRLVPLDDDWKRLPALEVAPVESRFAVFFKTPYWFSLDEPHFVLSREPVDAFVTLGAPLLMGPGKGRRFGCHDVPCTLALRPSRLGTVAEEAAAMRVDEADVEIQDGNVLVSVRSLNHAYTKASLRLEPHRRGPGGRAYDHMALIEDSGRKCISLEKLRCQAERKALQCLAPNAGPEAGAVPDHTI